MQRNSKLVVAVLILGVGVSAALMFRREPSTPDDGVGNTAEMLTYRSAAGPAPESLTTESSAQPAATAGRLAAGNQLAPWSDAAAGSPPSTDTRPTAPFGQVPVLPPYYGDPPAPASRVSPVPPERRLPPSPQNYAASRTPFLAAPANISGHTTSPQRTHTIVDGDTLPELARRYLGIHKRHQEIYELNRDQLRHGPDELPIGTVLEIPPLQATGPASRPDVEGGADLVPIPRGLFRRDRAHER